jgi:hypothetical protein
MDDASQTVDGNTAAADDDDTITYAVAPSVAAPGGAGSKKA